MAYSLYSDNFHDFFTEYVPFGEEAVLYFEEREHRRRFPRLLSNQRAKDDSPKVNIPTKSGLSWKVADSESNGSDLETKGRHMSAVDANVPKDKSAAAAPAASSQPLSSKGEAKEGAKKVDTAKKEAPVSKPKHSAPVEAKVAISASAANNAKKLPDVNEPSVFVPVSRIDPLSVKNADEPVVQDLVKILNDIITVVNADNATGKFTSTMNKAKSELASVGQKILGMKATEREAAQSQLKATEGQFESAARDLVNRLENEMQDQESRWRDELDAERQRIIQAYQERLQSEIQRSNEVKDQQLQNQLLEQAVALKKEFVEGVKSSVENERDGRLAKLSELSSSVNELESLTSQWNDVIDTNLKTQHLQVAVEAVRSRLERADRPRPFIKDLAALKEIAAEDPVVNSAIASINPAAYQRGVPTPAQLIDRFRRVADEVRKASLLPEDAGIASHAASLVLSKFMFKKQGRAVGDDVESILTRTETLLEEGSLDDAAREMNTLKGWAKTLSSDWLAEVRRVLEVRQALDVCSSTIHNRSLSRANHHFTGNFYGSAIAEPKGRLSMEQVL